MTVKDALIEFVAGLENAGFKDDLEIRSANLFYQLYHDLHKESMIARSNEERRKLLEIVGRGEKLAISLHIGGLTLTVVNPKDYRLQLMDTEL